MKDETKYELAKKTLEFIIQRKKEAFKLVDYALHGCPVLMDIADRNGAIEQTHDMLSDLFHSAETEAKNIIAEYESEDEEDHRNAERTYGGTYA